MNSREQQGDSNGFLIGLITGGAIGAGLALALAPRLTSELRERVTASAASLSHAATERYQDASTRITAAVDGVTARGKAVRDDVADAVGRGAREVEQFAAASKTVPGPRRS
jgi:gas vesicle protein